MMTVIDKVKEILESPATGYATAGSMSAMGILDLFYRVTQDVLGMISLLVGVIIGIIVLRIQLINLRLKLKQKKASDDAEEYDSY